ncbi:MAG: GntR family transcriptional regulator, partial [Chloroflexota bacterium]
MEAFDRSSLTDKVYSLLKARILGQALLPGQKVDVDGLAADLGISRTPVKDALNRLAADGLVNVLARRGTFVARFELDDLLELLDVRLALESYAARLGAVRADGAQLQAMSELVHSLATDFTEDQTVHADFDEFQARDRRFHLLTVTVAANRRLAEFCQSLHLDIQMAWAYYTRRDMELA